MAAAVFAGMMGFADLSRGSAIIGQTHQILIDRKAPQDVDAMKAEYRRPALVPFPDENRASRWMRPLDWKLPRSRVRGPARR